MVEPHWKDILLKHILSYFEMFLCIEYCFLEHSYLRIIQKIIRK